MRHWKTIILAALLLCVAALFLARLGVLLEKRLHWTALAVLTGVGLGGVAVAIRTLGTVVPLLSVALAGLFLAFCAHLFAWLDMREAFEAKRSEAEAKLSPMEQLVVAQQNPAGREPPDFLTFMTPPAADATKTYAVWIADALLKSAIAVLTAWYGGATSPLSTVSLAATTARPEEETT